MENFNLYKYYRNNLLEQEDVLEPKEVDPEDEFDPPVPKGQEEETPERVKFDPKDLFIAKFITVGKRYYIPFFAGKAKSAGYDNFESAVDKIWEDLETITDLQTRIEPDTEMDFLENHPNFVYTDDIIIINDPKATPQNPQEDLAVCPWVEYASRAPKDDTGIESWESFIESNRRKAEDGEGDYDWKSYSKL